MLPSSMLSVGSLKALLPLGPEALVDPPPTLKALMIESFNHITRAKIGKRMGTKGEGWRIVSLSVGFVTWGDGLYGSRGTGRACMAKMMY